MAEINNFGNHIDKLTSELNQTLKAKNHDYGDSYGKSVDDFGNVVMLIRISDKLNRLKQLLNSGDQKVTDESINDTLMDLAGYALLGLEYRLPDGVTDYVESTFNTPIEPLSYIQNNANTTVPKTTSPTVTRELPPEDAVGYFRLVGLPEISNVVCLYMESDKVWISDDSECYGFKLTFTVPEIRDAWAAFDDYWNAGLLEFEEA